MGRLLRVTSGGAWVLGAACLSLLALGGALDPPGWVGGAPAPYLKKPAPAAPPVTAAEAAGPYRLEFREERLWVSFRCYLHAGGWYTATYGAQPWVGRWRVRCGRAHVREWPTAEAAGPDEAVRWSFPLRRGRRGRVACDGLRCRSE